MRPKFIVYCLAIICLTFGWRGLTLTEKIEATSSTKLLDEIIEEEKSIGLERITQSEEE